MLGRCWHSVSIEQQKAEFVQSRCVRRRSEYVVCLYVYLFYCCNMVKVQGYDSPLHVMYVEFTWHSGQTNRSFAERLQLLT